MDSKNRFTLDLEVTGTMKHGMQNQSEGRPRGNRPPGVMGTRSIVEEVTTIMRFGPFSAACPSTSSA